MAPCIRQPGSYKRQISLLVLGLMLSAQHGTAQQSQTTVFAPISEAIARDGGLSGPFDGVFDAIVGPVAHDPVLPGYLLEGYRLVAEHRSFAIDFGGGAILPPHEDRTIIEFDIGNTAAITSAVLNIRLEGRGGQPILYIFGGEGDGQAALGDAQVLPTLQASVQLTNDNNANELALSTLDVTALLGQLVAAQKQNVKFVLVLQPNAGGVNFSGSLGPCCGPKLVITGPSQNTPTGNGIMVAPPTILPDASTGAVSLTFDNIVAGGETTVTTFSGGPPPPSGFKLTNPPIYYEIATTAAFSGSVRICLTWTEGQIANESKVRMFHFDGSQWVDITDPVSRDPVINQVCGTTNSLSPFALMEVKHPFTGFFQPVDNIPTINAVKAGAAVPVKFSLGGNIGVEIFAAGYPKAQLMQCMTGEPIAAVEETVNAGTSGLSYDAVTGVYSYVWKTDKAWANSCRELQVRLNDGETYIARFTMRK